MTRLIPKNDYFKHSTRKLLSSTEKKSMVETANASIEYLLVRARENKLEWSGIHDMRAALKGFRRRMAFLDRAVHFEKGRARPRRLYRRSRRTEIYLEARTIAEETGADVMTIYETFLQAMTAYVSDEP